MLSLNWPSLGQRRRASILALLGTWLMPRAETPDYKTQTNPCKDFQENHLRAFLRNAVPTLWYRLPDRLRQAEDIASFRRQLKSHLFSTLWLPSFPSPLSLPHVFLPLSSPPTPHPNPSISFAKRSEHGVFLHGVRLRSTNGHWHWLSPCQDPAGNRTTVSHRKETQTAVVWSCLPFIRSGQNHLARHSERGNKTRQTEEEVGRQHQGMDRPGVRQVPEGSGEQGKMEETGCEIICGTPMTLAVKG